MMVRMWVWVTGCGCGYGCGCGCCSGCVGVGVGVGAGARPAIITLSIRPSPFQTCLALCLKLRPPLVDFIDCSYNGKSTRVLPITFHLVDRVNLRHL